MTPDLRVLSDNEAAMLVDEGNLVIYGDPSIPAPQGVIHAVRQRRNLPASCQSELAKIAQVRGSQSNIIPRFKPPVTQPLQGATQAVGRNDVCPCGSGKKFKRCCRTTR